MKNNARLLRRYIRERLIAETLLLEGVLDPGILKAVFLAGGPGSGKSYTAKIIFGGDVKSSLSMATQVGLKILNSDPAFEHFLGKMLGEKGPEGAGQFQMVGISPKDLARISDTNPELSYQIGMQPDDPVTGEPMGVPPDSPRGKAKRIKKKQKGLWQEGRLGIIYDGTGDDYDSISKKRAQAEELGYDTAMVFINTTLEVAQERNADRDRVLPEKLVEKIWTEVQANLGGFQQLFGSDFYIIDNTVYGPPPEAVAKALSRFVAQPLSNPIGRAWVEEELSQRKAPKERKRLLGTEGVSRSLAHFRGDRRRRKG